MSATALVTEFLLAAEEGNIDALKACLEKGVDITRPTARKEPPLLLPV
ncbi:ankyrin repeat protein YahD [Enterobacter hormaechei]|nr:ankyrin repeat protein YahD [Enterobacter hormaechei]